MSARAWLFSLLAFLSAAAVALVLAFLLAAHIVTRPDYPARSGDQSLVAQEQGFALHDRNCQVLIYGDSTASIGIDPKAITAATNLTACNIAATRPIVDTLGTAPLDAFLAHNPRPRYLILQFGPEDFYRGPGWEHAGAYAPMIMLLRDLPRAQAVRTILLHPAQATQFLIFILTDPLTHRKDPVASRRAYDKAVSDLEANNGMLTLYLPANKKCVGETERLYGSLDSKWAQDLRTKYQAQGLNVILSASPMMDCDPRLAQYQRDLAPLVDSNTYTMPYQLFIGARHPTNEGARLVALNLAHMIQARESHPAP